jgi:hypothetical protein
MIIDPLQLLRARDSPNWTAADHQKLMGWMKKLFEWLKGSKTAKATRALDNNHATWIKTLTMGLAVYFNDWGMPSSIGGFAYDSNS